MLNSSTLLIGLGGTGCEIVSHVKEMLPKEIKNVECVGFDTNIQDLSIIDNIELVQMSTNENIGQYLNRTEGWDEWFPNEPLLKAKSLREGAGQIRSTSRLAFKSAIEGGLTGKVEEAINRLFLLNGTGSSDNLKVMIVSSLAGGTGSGIFLQVPSFIRNLCEPYLGEDSHIMIRGLFLLPDIFKDVMASPVQCDSLYANAYAAIRELNAINEICTDSETKIKMEFENFDSESAKGDAKKLPYNTVFFIDKQNLKGNVLDSMDQYKLEAAKIVYMQLFSPITVKQFSTEDNRFLEIIQSNGKSIYGTAGIAKCVYPYDDIVKYCGYCMALENIEESWMGFDLLFDEKFQQYLRDREEGVIASEPKRYEHLVENVEIILKEWNNTKYPFLRKELIIRSEENSKGYEANTVELYFDKIIYYLEHKYNEQASLERASADCLVNKDKMKDKKQIYEEVLRVKNAQDRFKRESNQWVNNVSSYLIQSIISIDAKSYLDSEYNLYSLINGGTPMHPVSARYVICKLQKLIENKLADIDISIKGYQINLESIERHNYSSKENIEVNAVDKADELDDKMYIPGTFKLLTGSFSDDFDGMSNEAQGCIRNEAIAKLQRNVFIEISSRLNEIRNTYERFFGVLGTIVEKISRTVEELERKNADVPGTMYVLADPEDKRNSYNTIKDKQKGNKLSNDTVYKNVNKALFDMTVEGRKRTKDYVKNRYQKSSKNDYANIKMIDLMEKTVISECIKDIHKNWKDVLDKDIYEALWVRSNGDMSLINKWLGCLFNSAKPLLSYKPSFIPTEDEGLVDAGDYIYTKTYWGMNKSVEDSVKNINPGVSISKYFNVSDKMIESDISVDDFYSKYELTCYNAVYGLRMCDIPKFREGTGEFYSRYKKRVDNISLNGECHVTKYHRMSEVSPHLNKKWHTELPLINSDAQELRNANHLKALIYGLSFADFKILEKEGKNIYFEFFGENNPGREINHEEKEIQEKELYLLFQAISKSPKRSEEIENYYRNFIEIEAKSVKIQDLETSLLEQKFVRRLLNLEGVSINLIDLFYYFFNDAGCLDNISRNQMFTDLLEISNKILMEYVQAVSDEEEVQEKVLRIIKNLCWEHSDIYKNKVNTQVLVSLKKWIGIE